MYLLQISSDHVRFRRKTWPEYDYILLPPPDLNNTSSTPMYWHNKTFEWENYKMSIEDFISDDWQGA